MSAWYLFKEGKRFGPYTWEQLWRFACEGRVVADDQVYSEALQGWKAARDVPGLLSGAKGGEQSTAQEVRPLEARPISEERPVTGADSRSGTSGRSVLRWAGAAAAGLMVFAVVFLLSSDRDAAREDADSDAILELIEASAIATKKATHPPRIILSEAVLPREEPQTFEPEGEVKVTLPPGIVDEPTELEISRKAVFAVPPPDAEVYKAYSISLGSVSEFHDVVEIEIPFSRRDIPSGRSAREHFAALYHREGRWEPIYYEVDEARDAIRIVTTHLSSFAAVEIDPSDPSNPMARTGHSSHYNPHPVFDSEQSIRLLQEMDQYREVSDGAVMAGWDAAMEWFGIAGASDTFAREAMSLQALSSVSDIAGEMGLGFTFIQLGIDIARGEYLEAALNLTQGLSGYAIGKWGTRAMKLGNVAVFIIDYVLTDFAETMLAMRYEDHERVYRRHYVREGTKRSAADWYEVAYEIAATSRSAEEADRRLKAELEKYVHEPWTDIGSLAVGEYETGGFVTGLNQGVMDKIAERHKIDIMTSYMEPVLLRLPHRLIAEETLAFRKNEMREMADALNREYMLRVDIQGRSENVGNLSIRVETDRYSENWEGETDAAGKWERPFTLLGFLNAGLPDEVLVEVPEGEELRASFELPDDYQQAIEVTMHLETDLVLAMTRGEAVRIGQDMSFLGRFTSHDGEQHVRGTVLEESYNVVARTNTLPPDARRLKMVWEVATPTGRREGEEQEMSVNEPREMFFAHPVTLNRPGRYAVRGTLFDVSGEKEEILDRRELRFHAVHLQVAGTETTEDSDDAYLVRVRARPDIREGPYRGKGYRYRWTCEKTGRSRETTSPEASITFEGPGNYSLSVDLVDPSGRVLSRYAEQVSIEQPDPVEAEESAPTVQRETQPRRSQLERCLSGCPSGSAGQKCRQQCKCKEECRRTHAGFPTDTTALSFCMIRCERRESESRPPVQEKGYRPITRPPGSQ